MNELISICVNNLLLVMSMMVGLWLLSLLLRDASIVDPFWGFGFVVVAWSTCLQVSTRDARVWLLVGMTTVWGLRLSGYLLWRNWGKGEDFRYRAMREKHGKRFACVSLVTVFLLQGLILCFVALPIQAGQWASQGRPLGWLDGLGLAAWLVGITFEAIGDGQLARFKANPANAGKVMDRGLWAYTRHPNYFGDFCIWWGHYLVAAAAGAWWTLLSPLLMSFFLLKVSGVTLLEKSIAERRPAYREYATRTNAFFPGPRRKS